MSAQLAVVRKTAQALELVEPLRSDITSIEDALEYLRQNPNSELAVQLMEDWLLDEANTYGHLNLDLELERIKNNDPVKNFMLERFIDGWLLKNGYLKASAEYVGKSYRRRLKELEKMKKRGKIGKFFLQVGTAIKIVFSEKNRSETIEELESATAEAVFARIEAREAQTKVQQAIKEANEIAIQASNERRQKLEKADQEATETTTRIKQAKQKDLDSINDNVVRLRQEVIFLEAEKHKLLTENPELALALKIHTKPVKELHDVYSRTFWNTQTERIPHTYASDEIKVTETQTTADKALLISSLCENGDHAPVLDLDFPVELIPSTTDGHFHLYINKRIPWKEYKNLLKALLEAKLIEKGWYALCIKRKNSMVLLPGIKRNEVSLPKESSYQPGYVNSKY